MQILCVCDFSGDLLLNETNSSDEIVTLGMKSNFVLVVFICAFNFVEP